MNLASRVRMLLSAAAVCTAVLSAYPAAADPIDTSLTLSANVFNGTNQVSGSGNNTHFDALPLPVAELNVRAGRDAVRLEVVPSIGITSTSTNGVDSSTTRLSIVNLEYRRFIGDGYFVGIGDSEYNETTSQSDIAETQSDHITGVRYEIGRLWHTRSGTVEASFAGSPALNGQIFTTYDSFVTGLPLVTFRDPERAAQIDAYLRASSRISAHADFVYGIRYLNFTGKFVNDPGSLSSRNVGFAPTIGVRIRR